jgi:hypothetical protein
MMMTSDYFYAIRCSKPDSIYYAISTGLDLKMLSMTTVEIWNHMPAIRDFVDAGGILTMADLTYAVDNISVNFEEVLQLIDPATIFECDENDEYDDQIGGPYCLTKLCGNDCTENGLIFVNSGITLITAVLVSNRSKKLEIFDMILDLFELPGSYLWKNIINACLHPDNHKIAVNIIEKLVTRQPESCDCVIHDLVELYAASVGIYNQHGAFAQNFTEKFDDNILLKILHTLNLDPADNLLAAECIYLNSVAAIKYLHENGFDIIGNILGSHVKRCRTLLKVTSFDVFNYLLQIGVDFKPYVDFFLDCNFGRFIDDKLCWFIDNIAKDDAELKTKIKNIVMKNYPGDELRQKIA